MKISDKSTLMQISQVFFLQNVENLMKFLEMEQKIEKRFCVFKIIAFESEAANSHNPEENICHCQSVC